MKKEQAKKKLEDLERSLGMARYRGAAMFPGPGIDEDIARIEAMIKKHKKLHNL